MKYLILIGTLLLLTAVSCCVGSSIETTTDTDESDNTTVICTPNLTCIPQESLPRIQALTDAFVKDLNERILEMEKNNDEPVPPETTKKGAEIIRKFVAAANASENPFSCVFSKDCWEHLDELVKEIEKEESSPLTTLKKTVESLERRMKQLRLLKKALKIAGGLLRRIRGHFG